MPIHTTLQALLATCALAAIAASMPVYAQSIKGGEIQWEQLAKATAKARNGTIEVTYPAVLLPYNGKHVTITGFMVPLEAKALQSRYLLTQKPQDCEFCLEGGPTSYIDVHGSPLKFSQQPMTLIGRLELLQKDPHGIYYRLMEAKLDKK